MNIDYGQIPGNSDITIVPSEDANFVAALLIKNELIDATFGLSQDDVKSLIKSLSKYICRKEGAALIAEERQRQIEVEGWTAEHDDKNPVGILAVAGACYALHVAGHHGTETKGVTDEYIVMSRKLWPFDEEWWKPTYEDPIRQLTKAGALIAAEIDRLQRANNQAKKIQS